MHNLLRNFDVECSILFRSMKKPRTIAVRGKIRYQQDVLFVGKSNQICIILLQVAAIRDDFSCEQILLADKVLRQRQYLILEIEDKVVGEPVSFSAGDLKTGCHGDNRGHTGSLDGHIQNLYNAILSGIGANVIGISFAVLIFGDSRHTGIEIGFIACAHRFLYHRL